MDIKEINTEQQLKDTLEVVLSELKDTILKQLDFKQAKILTYWLNDWNNIFLKNEVDFNPNELIKYKRGNIVKVHLGYNIGSEQGGLHYGIVLDNNNDKNSKVITIIPLRSLKEDEKPDDIDERFELYLGEALFIDKIAYVEERIKKIEEKIKNVTPENPEHKIYMSKKNKYQKELNNLKKGSVAIVSQIRTISKMRIYEPLKSYHSLSKFVLSNDKLKEIDDMIKNLFLGKNN